MSRRKHRRDRRPYYVGHRTANVHPAGKLMATIKGQCSKCKAEMTLDAHFAHKLKDHQLICMQCFEPIIARRPGMKLEADWIEGAERAMKAIRQYEAQRN